MKKIRIAIVDDNKQTLYSLADLITIDNTFELVFTAKNGQEYIKIMEDVDSTDHPKVVLMDIEMPIMSGIEAIQFSKMRFPFIKYIVLTSHDSEGIIFNAVQSGAHGYLLKDEKISVIRKSIIDLVNHQSTPMSPSVATKTFEILSKASLPLAHTQTSDNNDKLSQLTTREMDVLLLMKEGHNYKIIAEKLYISTNTVRTHIAHIYEKLHVTSKYQVLNLLKE